MLCFAKRHGSERPTGMSCTQRASVVRWVPRFREVLAAELFRFQLKALAFAPLFQLPLTMTARLSEPWLII